MAANNTNRRYREEINAIFRPLVITEAQTISGSNSPLSAITQMIDHSRGRLDTGKIFADKLRTVLSEHRDDHEFIRDTINWLLMYPDDIPLYEYMKAVLQSVDKTVLQDMDVLNRLYGFADSHRGSLEIMKTVKLLEYIGMSINPVMSDLVSELLYENMRLYWEFRVENNIGDFDAFVTSKIDEFKSDISEFVTNNPTLVSMKQHRNQAWKRRRPVIVKMHNTRRRKTRKHRSRRYRRRA